MRLLITLALRNLLRHKRRTLLTAAALVFGIGIMILGRAWSAATEKAVVEPAKLSTLGHVQAGPSGSGDRVRAQTTASCFGPTAEVVSVAGKGGRQPSGERWEDEGAKPDGRRQLPLR